MADVKDILGVPRSSLPSAASDHAKPEKPVKERAKRPEGLSREAYALLDGSNPIAPSRLVDELRLSTEKKTTHKKSISKGKVVYQWKGFKNPARGDSLELFHWVKCLKDANGRIKEDEEGPYKFAKFNKKVQLYRYDNEEYDTIIARGASDGWSRQETDYLLDLCERFDLRFIVIADQYNFPGGPQRTMDELKERYYTVARKLLIAREGGEKYVANHVLVKNPFKADAEEMRKAALAQVLCRTARQAAEESRLLAEANAIMQQRTNAQKSAAPRTEAAIADGAPSSSTPPAAAAAQQQQQQQQQQPAALLHERVFANDAAELPFFDQQLQPCAPQAPGVYRRSVETTNVAQAMVGPPSPASARLQKAVDAAMVEVGATAEGPRMYTRATVGQWLALRAEVISWLETRKKGPGSATLGDGGAPRHGNKRKSSGRH